MRVASIGGMGPFINMLGLGSNSSPNPSPRVNPRPITTMAGLSALIHTQRHPFLQHSTSLFETTPNRNHHRLRLWRPSPRSRCSGRRRWSRRSSHLGLLWRASAWLSTSGGSLLRRRDQSKWVSGLQRMAPRPRRRENGSWRKRNLGLGRTAATLPWRRVRVRLHAVVPDHNGVAVLLHPVDVVHQQGGVIRRQTSMRRLDVLGDRGLAGAALVVQSLDRRHSHL